MPVMKTRFNHARLSAFLLALAACSPVAPGSKGGMPADARTGQVAPDRVELQGPLQERLNEIQNHEQTDPCDQSLDAIKRKIVLALEEHDRDPKGNTESPASSNSSPGPKANTIPFHGSHLVDIPKIESGSKGWKTSMASWTGLNQYFNENIDHPPAGFWDNLNQAARSLLLEDRIRVVNGTNRGLDHGNIPHIPAIVAAVEKCNADPACSEPLFESPEVELAVKSVPMYRFFDQRIRSQDDFSERRKLLERFLKRTKADLADHGFRRNPLLQVEKSGDNTILNLAMDPGILGETEQGVLQSIIESIWSTDGKKTTVSWASKKQMPDLFEILFHADSPGERPYVMPHKKTMNLFPGTRTRSVAHEFGHVLGFDDHYYTVWDPDRCLYIYETNDSDLMSNSASGEVTPEEWRTLIGVEEKPAT
jgi:hypothetical protein